MEVHIVLVRRFLAENPEFIPDVRWMDVGKGRELVIADDALPDFLMWAERANVFEE